MATGLSRPTVRNLIALTAFAFFLAGPTRGEPVRRAIDLAGEHEVAPDIVIPPNDDTARRPGPDATLLRELAQAVREIKTRLARLDEGKRTITVGSFTCPTNANATGGALLRHLLTQELKKAHVAVGASGGVGVSGKFRNVTDPASGTMAAKITFELEDEEGEKVGKPFSHVVLSEKVIADLFGATTPLSPLDSPKERSMVLARSIKKPTVAIAGSHVASRVGNKFAVEVLVADEPDDEDADLGKLRYRPLRSTNQGGLAFVRVKPKQFYAVRLINGSDEEVAVTLSIDGLSTFTLSKSTDKDGHPYHSHVLVPARSNVVVKGWFLNNRETSLFKITGFGESVARAKGGSLADVGTITATFATCTRPKPKPPAVPGSPTDEAVAPRGKAGSPPATGKGPTVKVLYGYAERNVGVIQDTISVRYVWASKTSPPESRPSPGSRPRD